MRTIQFKLSPDEACLVEKILELADYTDLTPKQLFMRFVRTKLEVVSKELVEAAPKPKGRPPVTVDGYEKKEWVSMRVAAYNEAEAMAVHEDPDHERCNESVKRVVAEGCWDDALAGVSYTGYLKTVDGKTYTINFPPIEGE